MREVDLNRELTCKTCGETHSDFHKEIYNHNPALSPIIACERCGCGYNEWKY